MRKKIIQILIIFRKPSKLMCRFKAYALCSMFTSLLSSFLRFFIAPQKNFFKFEFLVPLSTSDGVVVSLLACRCVKECSISFFLALLVAAQKIFFRFLPPLSTSDCTAMHSFLSTLICFHSEVHVHLFGSLASSALY